MSEKRLPSFNDFSPVLFPDIRIPLAAVQKSAGDREAASAAISAINGWPVSNKRAKNVLITLQYLGLTDKATTSLTPLGTLILASPSAEDAVKRLCKHILENMNGRSLIDAIRNLNKRSVSVSKASLKTELIRLGVTGLSTATTDHTTLANWMAAAGVLHKSGNDYSINDAALKSLIGISSEEASALDELKPSQRYFAVILRRITATTDSEWIPSERVISECLRLYPQVFDEDQMRKKVFEPLVAGGWIATTGLTGGRGAKSGQVKAAQQLLDIPIEYVVPKFDSAVPPDLKGKINTPLPKIKEMLESASKNERGLGLELLALRMILDLTLSPCGFRKRTRSTGYAEVDVIAEGKNLLFSRWMFQCKAVQKDAKVDSEDVAREVGIAIHAKAHVIAMVSTGGFTSAAKNFAREITSTTPLQFLFLDGLIVRDYLSSGVSKLIEFVLANAGEVMKQKQEQLTPDVIGADAELLAVGALDIFKPD